MESLKIITCNVRGMADIMKRRQIFWYFQRQNVDITMLQETHSTISKETFWKSESGKDIIFDHGTSQARGVCIMYNKNLKAQVIKIEKSNNGRYLIVQLILGQKAIVLANIYAPNESSRAFFMEILRKIEEIEADVKIIGGDFNTLLNPEVDRKSLLPTPKITKEAKLINAFMEEYSWADVWRLLHPDKRSFTWIRQKPITMSRLDYFLLPYGSMTNVVDCEIIPGLNSDHSFVKLTIKFTDNVRGRGFWKMNNRLLYDKEYVNETNKIIDMAEFRYADLDPGTKLEMLKMDLSEFSTYFSRNVASK